MGIAIEESYPPQFFNGSKLTQQRGNTVFHAEILAIRHGVLRNKNQLANTLFREATRFGDQILHATASELAAKSRNSAKRADMIAAFGNLEISHVGRRAENPWDRRNFPRRVQRVDGNVRNRLVAGSNGFQDFPKLIRTENK